LLPQKQKLLRITSGKKNLPDPQEIANKLLKRKKFIPCPQRTNVIFPFFAQHFTHQFFKTKFPEGMPNQWGFNNVRMCACKNCAGF